MAIPMNKSTKTLLFNSSKAAHFNGIFNDQWL